MKISQRLFAFVLCAILVVGMLPAQIFAAETDAVKVEHNGTTTYYADLQKAFDGFAPSNNTYGGTYVVTLLDDTTGVNKNLQYPTEVLDVTLDLNGHTITGDGSTIAVVINFGSKNSKECAFTIKDSSGDNSGKITGGKGGVKVDGSGSFFYFQGGTITGNHGATKGGGILVGAKTKFVMTGGVITGNSVTGNSSANTGYGGGVLTNYASITGGIITGNTAYKGSHLQTGRGGGVCTEITRTAGYSTLEIADGIVFGNTAENAGDDVMAQGNGNVKFTFVIGTENWYVDGWKGTKAGSGGGQTDRYSETSPVAYTDGGFTDVKNVTVGLKYVAPEEPSVPTYTVTLSEGDHYSIAPVDGFTTTVEENGEFQFTVTPVEGWQIDSVMAGENQLTAVDGVYTITVTADITITVNVSKAKTAPDAPSKYGENVTPELIRVICDSDPDHAPLVIKWQHQSTKVYPGAQVEWDEELGTYKIKVRIDSVGTYYVWMNFEEVYNEIVHDMVDEDQMCIDTYLKWDAAKQLWVTMDEKPIDVHVTCITMPQAPAHIHMKSYQIQVMGDLDGDGIFGENGLTNDSGIFELFATSIPEGSYTLSGVYGNREEGFFIDVTVTLSNGDIFISNWIEKRAPGMEYVYDWSKTDETFTFTLKYTGDLIGDLYGNRAGDWVLASNGNSFGAVAQAYVMPAPPAPPKQSNVTDKLVTIICDSDADRHGVAYGKWYPQHCSTTSDIVWNAELGTWTVDVRIGSLYIMYVSQLEDANNGTTHKLADDITTVYATLMWDDNQKLWIPVEAIELHTTCQTAPTAPTYKQLSGYQIKVWGDVNGQLLAYTTSIPENGYTISDVYGSREEGFFVDVTVSLSDDDIYQLNWIAKKNPGYFYNYDWDLTAKTVTFTLKYNGSLTGTLYGHRHASNTNYDWVLESNSKHFGVVTEAYLKQITSTVNLVIYRNGNTTTPYKIISLGEIAKGETLDLSALSIDDYYSSSNGFEFKGWFNAESWNQFKNTGAADALSSIYIDGATDIICMVRDYQVIIIHSVVNGDINTAKVLDYGTALFGENLIAWLDANVDLAKINGYTANTWWNWSSFGQKITDADTITGLTEVYVDYQANQYTLTLDANGGTIDPFTVTVTFDAAIGTLPTPTRPGYTFTGWFDADGNAVTADTVYTVAGDSTCTAAWAANTYTVTLDANKGTVDPSTITVTFDAAIGTLPTPTRPGYTFTGWFDAAGNAVTADTVYTVVGDSTYTAGWAVNSYTVTLDANGGTVDPATLTVTFDAAVGALPVPTKPGYTFVGWMDANGTKIIAETIYTIDGDSTWTAEWSANTYNIKLDALGGTVDPAEMNVVFNQAVNTLPVPTKPGYTFGGWFDADGNEYTAETIYTVIGDITLTAKWTVNTYTITLNDGTTESTINVTFDAAIGELPVPKLDGHTFGGWFAADGNEYTAETIYTVPADTTLTAKWTANTYTVTLDDGNGNTITIEVTYGQPVGEMPEPTREGYYFEGWVDAEGNEVSAETVYASADASVYTAVWSIIPNTGDEMLLIPAILMILLSAAVVLYAAEQRKKAEADR